LAVVGQPPFLKGSYDLLLADVSHSRLQRLDRAILAYHLAQGSLPRTLEDVVGRGLVDRTYLKDPWKHPFHYALTEQGYLLSAVDDAGRTLPQSVIDRIVSAEK
jgi:DNA-binding HxlR family transcriptional regulator